MGRRVYAATFAHETHPDDMAAFLAATYTPARLAAELCDGRQTLFVAEFKDLLAGFAQMSSGPPHSCVTGPAPVQLQRLYIDARWHGRGVAQALMAAALAWAAQASFATLWLGVAQTNGRAQRFYRKLGLRVAGQQIFHIGQDPQNDLIMVGEVSLARRMLHNLP